MTRRCVNRLPRSRAKPQPLELGQKTITCHRPYHMSLDFILNRNDACIAETLMEREYDSALSPPVSSDHRYRARRQPRTNYPEEQELSILYWKFVRDWNWTTVWESYNYWFPQSPRNKEALRTKYYRVETQYGIPHARNPLRNVVEHDEDLVRMRRSVLDWCKDYAWADAPPFGSDNRKLPAHYFDNPYTHRRSRMS